MLSFFIGLLIGTLAGFLEIAMVRNYEKNKFMLAAIVVNWAGIGALMPFVDFGLNFWLKGLIVGTLATLPLVVLSAQKSRNATLHTLIFIPF